MEGAGVADHPPARRRDGAEGSPRQFDDLGYPYGGAVSAVAFKRALSSLPFDLGQAAIDSRDSIFASF